MAEHVQANTETSQKDKAKERKNKLVTGAVLVIVVLYLILIATATWHPGIHERVKFGTENGVSLAILVAVIAQVVIYYGQLGVMERQVALSRVSERAYLGVKHIHVLPFSIGEGITVGVTVLNGGRTPAFNVLIPTLAGITETAPVYEGRPDISDLQPLFLPVGIEQKVRLTYPVPLDDEMLQALESERVKLYVHLDIIFDDCWGDTQVYPFSVKYNWKGKMFEGYKDTQEKKEANPN